MAQGTTQPLSHLPAGWRGELSLRLVARAGRTVLGESRHRGPLMVQRAFHPEPDGSAHLYVLHPPGGLVGGDELQLAAQLAPGARALLTTPAAGKVYRSAAAVASVEQCLHVADGAALEWLPQELIVYQGARLRALTRVELAGTARFIGWEILCLGRPAAGEGFAAGCARLALELWRDGRPLYREHGHYPGGGAILSAPWGLAGLPVSATLLACPADTDLLTALRATLPRPAAPDLAALTLLDGVLMARWRGGSAEAARRWLNCVWALLRPLLLDKPPCPPRIWNT